MAFVSEQHGVCFQAMELASKILVGVLSLVCIRKRIKLRVDDGVPRLRGGRSRLTMTPTQCIAQNGEQASSRACSAAIAACTAPRTSS